jgi:glyoxylase-like metal-dependent hydrolase (beta-lactamase superfamily II)
MAKQPRIHRLDLQFLGRSQTIASYLVPCGDGFALIDCGPYSTYQNLVKELGKKGIEPHLLKAVLLTHIHFDHAGAAWALAAQGVPVYVHPVGYPHMLQPEKLYQSAARIYGNRMEELWGIMQPVASTLIHAVADRQPVRIGTADFLPIYTPGHAHHHISWIIDNHMFTGDSAGVRINSRYVSPPCPPPDIDIEVWLQSIDTMRSYRPTSLYLAHFGDYDDVEAHFDNLKANLLTWAAWFEPHAAAGTDLATLQNAFPEFIKDTMLANGIPEADVQRYENANPSFMSVAGLMRYWKQKTL